MPCDVSFWGKPENKNEVVERMQRNGYPLRSSRQSNPTQTKSGGWNQQTLYSMGVASPQPIRISQDQMRGELDKLFEKLPENDKTTTMEPAQVRKVKFFLFCFLNLLKGSRAVLLAVLPYSSSQHPYFSV